MTGVQTCALPICPDVVQVVSLVRDDGGWWSVPAEAAGDLDVPADGTRYAFAVDGGDPVPDPRSLRLPDGVRKVEVRAKGNERIISPVGQSWDSFFLNGPAVSDDFMPERASQHQSVRESL